MDAINELFNTRYEYLLNCAKNILKLIRRQDLKYELVTDLFFYLNNNKEKIQPQIDKGKLEAVAVRWMTQQIKWPDTKFKADWVYPSKFTTSAAFDTVEAYIIHDDEISEEDYLSQEKEIQDKMNHVQFVVSQLPLDKKILFEDVFLKGINSTGKLASHTNLSRTGCYYLIKDLKFQITSGWTGSF